MTRVTEAEIAIGALRIAAGKPNGEATIEEIKAEIPNLIQLSPDDRAPSKTRPREELWEQQVRNVVSHREAEGNVIREGYAEHVNGGIRITDAGRAFLERHGY